MAAGVAGIMASIVLGGVWGGSGAGRVASASLGEGTAPAAPGGVAPAPEQAAEVIESRLGRGGSLYTALTGAGLTPRESHPVLAAFADVVEPRHLRPEDQVRLEMDVAGVWQRIEVIRGPEERYEATRDHDRVSARRVPVVVETRLRRFTGRVETSLYEAILAAGGGPERVAQVADLLAWDIDFFTDPRPGDVFDLLVEERWLDGRLIGAGPILIASYEGARARQSACRFEHAGGVAGYYDVDGKSLRKALLKSPLNYRRISSHFSHRRRHPITKRVQPHLGVDFAAPRGTPVVAVGDGTVSLAARKGANGNMVVLRHPSRYETYYLHLAGFASGIRRGARVQQGQVIGFVGSTGRSTGPHLDFRVKHRGRFVNPLRLTLPPGPPVPAEEMSAFRDVWGRLGSLRAAMEPGGPMTGDSALRLGGYVRQVARASGAFDAL